MTLPSDNTTVLNRIHFISILFIDLLSSNHESPESIILLYFPLKVSLESNSILPILLSFPSLESSLEILPILINSSLKINMLVFRSICQTQFPFSFHFISRNFNQDSSMKEWLSLLLESSNNRSSTLILSLILLLNNDHSHSLFLNKSIISIFLKTQKSHSFSHFIQKQLILRQQLSNHPSILILLSDIYLDIPQVFHSLSFK